jgi:peptidoglycan/LPS O-acetylase OafA/YrhL
MGEVISHYTNTRDNNFNLLRFLAAVLVLYAHSYYLTASQGDVFAKFLGIDGGKIALDVFFITSGFLVANSLFIRNNPLAFIWARILRIYPALIVAVLFCIVAVGLFFTTETTSNYLSDPQTQRFLLKNTTMFSIYVEWNLPGVFLNNPHSRALNGSLWTLPVEIRMYVYLFLLGTSLIYLQRWINKNIFKFIFLSIALIAIAIQTFSYIYGSMPTYGTCFFNVFFRGPPPSDALRLFTSFFIGSAFYMWRDHIVISSKLFFAILFLFFLLVIYDKKLFLICYSILLPYLVFYLAYIPKGTIRRFNHFGDYSYGLYIYAFPVQQSIAALFPNISVSKMILLAFVISFILAFLSWHLIEKRCLKMKGNYILLENIIHRIRPSKRTL